MYAMSPPRTKIMAPVISRAAQSGTNRRNKEDYSQYQCKGPGCQQGNNDRQVHDLPEQKVNRFENIVLQKQVRLLLHIYIDIFDRPDKL